MGPPSGRQDGGSVEVRILLAGIALGALTALAFGVGWALDPDATRLLAAMTGLNMLIGRAAGMSFGYASGLGHVPVIASSVLVETIYVLIVFPLFVLAWRRWLDGGRMPKLLAGLPERASRGQGWVRRFGIAGLFAFVFVPFWMTGPSMGAILGHLIGLRPRVNLAVVLTSTYAAIGVWAALLNRLSEAAAAYNRYALFAAIVVIAVVAIAWQRLARRRPAQ